MKFFLFISFFISSICVAQNDSYILVEKSLVKEQIAAELKGWDKDTTFRYIEDDITTLRTILIDGTEYVILKWKEQSKPASVPAEKSKLSAATQKIFTAEELLDFLDTNATLKR